jgi:hypothetical protein
MSNYISLLLEAEVANRRLAQLFQSEELDRASQQSISLVTRDSNGGARREQNSKMPQENRHERTPVRSRTRTVIPNTGSGATKRDLTVSSFMLALVLAGVVVAAHTDHPVFWLFIGPIPVAVLHTTRAFLRQRVIRRGGPLMFSKRARLYQEPPNKNSQPDRRRLASAFMTRPIVTPNS